MSKHDKQDRRALDRESQRHIHEEVTKAVLAPDVRVPRAYAEASQSTDEAPMAIPDAAMRELETKGSVELPYETPTLTRVQDEAFAVGGMRGELLHVVAAETDQGGQVFAVCCNGCGSLPMSNPSDIQARLAHFDELVAKSTLPNAKHVVA